MAERQQSSKQAWKTPRAERFGTFAAATRQGPSPVKVTGTGDSLAEDDLTPFFSP